MLLTNIRLKCLNEDYNLDQHIAIFDGALNDFFQDEEDRFSDPNFLHEVRLYLSSYLSWPTDSTGNIPTVEYQKLSSDSITIEISADFEANSFGGTSFNSFSRELFAFLDHSPYMKFFEIVKEETYSVYSVYDKTESLSYLDRSLYATEDDLAESVYVHDGIGDIYTLDELDKLIEDESITDYDGHGELLRLDKDGRWYKSALKMSVDYEISEYVRRRFTHFIWYNR